MKNTGVQINNSSYDFVVDEGDENLLTAIKNGKRGYIDKNGTEIIPCIYDVAENYSDGLFSVCLQNKWGAIDILNNIIIPFEYEELWPCRNNTMPAKKNEKWGFIDKDNNVLVDFLYDEIGAGFLGEICVFSVVLNGKCGLIDRQGNVVEEFIYDKMQLLSDNGEFIRIKKGQHFALYNAVARVFLTDFSFDFIGFINDDKFEAILEGNRVFIGKKGELIEETAEETEGYFLTRIGQDETGLPMNINLRNKQNGSERPFLRFQNDRNPEFNYNWVKMYIDGEMNNNENKEIVFSQEKIALLKKWVELNKEAILKHYYQEYDTKTVCKLLQPLKVKLNFQNTDRKII